MVDYEPSPTHESMDVNVVYLSSLDYSLVGDDEVAQMDFSPKEATFQKLRESDNHLNHYTSGRSQWITDILDAC